MRRVACLSLLALACASDSSPAAPGPLDPLRLGDLEGSWRWLHASAADGTLRFERERWHFEPARHDAAAGASVARGVYRRDVAVIASDGQAFLCNQRIGYLQRARFDVVARVDPGDGAIVIDEVGYQPAPSPCEPGFRHLARYRVEPGRDRLRLRWGADGEQTLERVPDFDAPALALPRAPAGFAGAWRWSLRSRDAQRQVRREDEAWEVAVSADGAAGATYVREVTTWTEDSAVIPCAGAPSWRYTDRYTLRGALRGGELELTEVAVDPGAHPCLTTTPERHLDAARGNLEGDHLVLTWRGQRRQVLHRPER